MQKDKAFFVVVLGEAAASDLSTRPRVCGVLSSEDCAASCSEQGKGRKVRIKETH